MDGIKIRRESNSDYDKVEVVVREAFREQNGDGECYENVLVNGLRLSEAFVPELSLVAENESGDVVGHILLTKITIDGKHVSLALAPVAVLPEYQGQGIGSALIVEAHRKATELGYKSIVLLGHADYYPRFGYVRLANFGISLPMDAPEECCMAIELVEDGLKGVSGRVEYPKEFMV